MHRIILIADDSSTIRQVVVHAFAGEDSEVVTAVNGPEAVEQAQRHHPSIALVDVLMPGMNGYEVAEALASDPATAEIPVLLLTGAFEPFDEGRAGSCGAVGHLAKPFEKVSLIDRVEQILGTHPTLRPKAGARQQSPLVSDEDLLPPVPGSLEEEPFPAQDTMPSPVAEMGAETGKSPASWGGPRVPLPGDEDFDLSPSRRGAGSEGESASGGPGIALDEKVLREEIRRRVEALAPEIIREIAWEVVPDLLERVIRETAPRPVEKTGDNES